MKRKVLGMLMCAFMIMPLNIFAAEEYNFEAAIVQGNPTGCDLDDTKCNATAQVKFKLTEAPNDELEIAKGTVFTGTIQLGKDKNHPAEYIEIVSVKGSNDFTVTRDGLKVTYTATKNITIAKDSLVDFGSIEYTYDKTESDENCAVLLNLTNKTSNPQTGISIPVIALGGVGLLAIAGLAVANKKNKLQNI